MKGHEKRADFIWKKHVQVHAAEEKKTLLELSHTQAKKYYILVVFNEYCVCMRKCLKQVMCDI